MFNTNKNAAIPFTISEEFITRPSVTVPFTISNDFIMPCVVAPMPIMQRPMVPVTSAFVPTTVLPYSVEKKQYVEQRAIITYPGVRKDLYLVTSAGDVYNVKTGRLMSTHERWGNEYISTTLQTEEGGSKPFSIHRLVAYQFCNPPYNFKQLTVNHIDGDKTNNYSNNLEWITVAANNQHAQHLYSHPADGVTIHNKRPLVDESFVRYICSQFAIGKSNTEIMNNLGIETDNANHTLFRDIRGGYTWKHISRQYSFDRSSKKHAYTNDQKKKIEKLMIEGKSLKEIFKIMIGREYVAATDRKDSSYRTIQSIQTKLRGYGYNV